MEEKSLDIECVATVAPGACAEFPGVSLLPGVLGVDVMQLNILI